MEVKILTLMETKSMGIPQSSIGLIRGRGSMKLIYVDREDLNPFKGDELLPFWILRSTIQIVN